MSTNEKKGITVKIDAKLHAEVREYLESHEMTMAEFVTLAFQDELHPKLNYKEEKSMGNMRTLAFQVPEELFQKIKDYLQHNNMSQKEFVIGLIENEIELDLAKGASTGDAPTDIDDAENSEKQQETDAVDESLEDAEENEDLDEEYSESEDIRSSMEM